MRLRNPLKGRNYNPPPLEPVEAAVFREVEVSESEYIAREGAIDQSTDYDGTTVGDADATTGWRVESTGDAEFQDLRARGELYATHLNMDGLIDIGGGGGFEVDTEGWTVTAGSGTLARVTTDFQSGVASLEFTASAAGNPSFRSGPFVIAPEYANAGLWLDVWVRNVAGNYADIFVTWYSDTAGTIPLVTATYSSAVEMQTGWQHNQKHLGIPPAGAQSLRIAITGASSTFAVGEKFRVDDWTIYSASTVRGARVLTEANQWDPKTGSVEISSDYVSIKPDMAGAAVGIASGGRGGLRGKQTRWVGTGQIRPGVGLVGPLTDVAGAKQASVDLWSRRDDNLGVASQIDLITDYLQVNNAPAIRYGRMGKSASFNTNSGADSVIAFETELDTLTGGWVDLPAWSIVIPAGNAGVIDITLQVRWAANSTGSRFIWIEKGGVRVAANLIRAESSGQVTIHQCNYKGEVSGGEQFVAWGRQDSGGLLAVQATNDDTHMEFIFHGGPSRVSTSY